MFVCLRVLVWQKLDYWLAGCQIIRIGLLRHAHGQLYIKGSFITQVRNKYLEGGKDVASFSIAHSSHLRHNVQNQIITYHFALPAQLQHCRFKTRVQIWTSYLVFIPLVRWSLLILVSMTSKQQNIHRIAKSVSKSKCCLTNPTQKEGVRWLFLRLQFQLHSMSCTLFPYKT